MRIPKPDSVETLIYRDRELKVIVCEVEPERGLRWRVWVDAVSPIFQNGDVVQWRASSGEQYPSFVSELKRVGSTVRFAREVGENW